MTIHINKLIEFLAEIYEDKNMKATGTASLRGGVITGLSAIIGGLLLGPVGLAIGGTLGGVGSAVAANNFQSIPVILRNMDFAQKKKLAEHLVAAFRDFGPSDIVTLTMLLKVNDSFQDLAIRHVNDYFQREMQMRIMS